MNNGDYIVSGSCEMNLVYGFLWRVIVQLGVLIALFQVHSLCQDGQDSTGNRRVSIVSQRRPFTNLYAMQSLPDSFCDSTF